ncbi:hypothetical protein BH11CYA1_BH11CYA1_42290 [soil metagenome]
MKIQTNLFLELVGILSLQASAIFITCMPVIATNLSPDQPIYQKTTHPIFSSKQDYSNGRLTRAGYRKMINLPVQASERSNWASLFGHIEALSSADLCDSLSGLTKKEIADWLGQPTFRMGSDLCFPKVHDSNRAIGLIFRDIKPSVDNFDDNWLYFFGGRPLLIRLYFNGDKCISAHSALYENDELYNIWRYVQLSRKAVGQSMVSLLEKEGPPDTATDRSFERTELDKDVAIAAILKSADQILYYQFGETIGAVLAIKNGHCFFVCPAKTIRGVFGKKDWGHEPTAAIFKSPM